MQQPLSSVSAAALKPAAWDRNPRTRPDLPLWLVACAAVLKVNRNENFGKLQAGYLFPEVWALAQ